MKMSKGYIQVYTGNGKGKTTAALGQALRAAGAGLKTFCIMFMKEFPYSELKALNLLSSFITVEQCGKDDFIYKRELPGENEKAKVKKGLNTALYKMQSGEYDVVILDEVLVSIYFKLIEEKDLLSFISQKPQNTELILTGRYAPQSVIDIADLVTEMTEVKHYYQQGVQTRKGIES